MPGPLRVEKVTAIFHPERLQLKLLRPVIYAAFTVPMELYQMAQCE
jgi:hypothetical protein